MAKINGTKQTKGNTGNRYSDEQKKEIVAFVQGQGRGGIARAQEKYGVSYIALRNWMKSNAAPAKKPGPKMNGNGEKAKPGRKPGFRTAAALKLVDKILKGRAKEAEYIDRLKAMFPTEK